MSVERFGDVAIFRPSSHCERAFREAGRRHLLSHFKHGSYRGANSANLVIQHQFNFYAVRLKQLIPKLARRDAFDFLLFQYDQAFRLLHCRGILDLRERERWDKIESSYKRAIKYLLESICIEISKSRGHLKNSEEAGMAMESAIVCAESMIGLSQQSVLAHSIFPDDCVAHILDSNSLCLETRIEGKYKGFNEKFTERILRDRESRHQYAGFPQFDNSTAKHQSYLDDAFAESFDMPYGWFIECLRVLIEQAQPSLHPNALPTLFIRRSNALAGLALSGQPLRAIERAVNGFSVTAQQLQNEGRVIWKAKQKSRAYLRGFFVIHEDGAAHLAFSRAMARESLIQLVNWVCYQQIPIEWQSEKTTRAVKELSVAAGKWFEEEVIQNLVKLNIKGGRMRTNIVGAGPPLKIPDLVGEMDFLGYSPKDQAIVFIESKMVMSGIEPAYWRSDIDKFITTPNCHAEHFRRKLVWIKENLKAIAAAIGCPTPSRLAAAMITLYPCIAGTLLTDFSCVSLTEFMLDYEMKKGWPYPTIN